MTIRAAALARIKSRWAMKLLLRISSFLREPGAYPSGHFYSPVVDPRELAAQREQLWPATPPPILGIDFDPAQHLQILKEWFPRHIGAYDYPEHGPDDASLSHFYTQNSQFSWLDARALFVLLRELAPRRIIEVGSGYSSLLMADINQRFWGGSCEIRCIEPYPRPFLQRGVPGIREVIVARVQQVPLDLFATLAAGDVLFIDSSHVCKTGSDVNTLFFEVLPRLAPGVIIHLHDIALPLEYPQEWAITLNRSWNEQYLLRALLMYSQAFKPLFGSSYAYLQFKDAVAAALALPGGQSFGGSSFWMRRV